MDNGTVEIAAELKQYIQWTRRDPVEEETLSAIDLMLENMTILEPRRGLIAYLLSKRIREKYDDPSISVVLMGGSVHGGAVVRNIIEPNVSLQQFERIDSNPDIDWGITFNTRVPLSSDEFLDIAEIGDTFIPEISEKLRFNPPLESCWAFNPALVQIPNLEGTEEDALWGQLRQSEKVPYKSWAVATPYFFPSFPSKVNERNLAMLKKHFKWLYTDSPNLWSMRVNEMLELVATIRTLKPRYFIREHIENIELTEMIRHSVQSSKVNNAMLTPYRRFFESTKD